ncbi:MULTISPECIES: CHAT domain-containing protein [Aequorivita]|uniref:CHAT domain-containing protein n=1 Tax=Aequorivita iocasae TaxID=2803865 RepID=A0ABX7DTX4_9FLAO|nr:MULTISPECIES: CHAT domain-containing tetratricopeptide repeat protein [Aequorivita]QQX77262.1 CHAT domain-containing protein [Aequorivita iocasae]UCA56751.1 CHAT domain-containing protein [Aequorivita sp. F7]
MINKNRRFAFAFPLLFLFTFFLGFTQEKNTTVKKIQTLIEQDSLAAARTEVAKSIAFYKAEKKYDSLYSYIQFEGSFKLNNGNKNLAVKKAENLTEEIKRHASPHYIVEAITELGWIYDDAGKHEEAYKLLKTAIPFAQKNTEPNNTDRAGLEYRQGFYASKLGDFPLAKSHYLKALKLLIKTGQQDYVFYNQIYNALGGMMWQEAKLDSAKYYFQEAVNVLEKTDETDIMNRYYRPALVKMNLAVLWNALGKNQEAIAISEESIEGFQEYINRSTDEARTYKAKNHQFIVIDNMATFYNTLGEHSRAQELIEYSFEQKKKLFEENDINIIISNIILAEAKTASRDFEGAAKNADTALLLLKSSGSADLYWEAAALSTRATIYEHEEDVDNAALFYEKARIVYQKTMGTTYTKDFLDNIMEYSLFAAKNGKKEKALALANETYNFTHNGDFKNTLQEFYHTVNLAQVYYHLKEYAEAEKYSDEALRFNVLDKGGKISTTDSILTQYRKPQALLINAASKYYLAENKNPFLLKELLQQIEEGISILDQRKKIITNHEDVTLLITENEELLTFAEKLRLELYETTKNPLYLDKLIALHESSIYNRIRSRLNLRDNVRFQHIPTQVLERESTLKDQMRSSLNDSENGSLYSFFEASENWESFLDSLKQHFPKYYKMRYATLEESLTDLQQKIPENTTVVRYIFIEDQLYAFVVSPSIKKMVRLNYTSVKNHISKIKNDEFSVEKTRPLLYELYRALWFPLEKYVFSHKVVIVPDRELFNLSFETLTPKPIKNFQEMATNSLLAKYDISYNFSLLLYKDQGKVADYSSDFIAFAPGFNKKMKEEYQLAIKDSVKLDKTYLTLLPQPFSEELVKQYSKIFNGRYFVNENASKDLFIKQAKEHKIIHIGTHAESNNISPELSRLIFAKKTEVKESYDENSLYSYEIYNINLSSNLAILTACETGKPTYQAGEGMISLAHAFNYAGSESILTSLWEIDEESSAKIVKLFYDNLSEGIPKDEALRKAKLRYIETAEGRTAAPQYWAGLVLIGDTASIDLKTGAAWWWYLLAGIVALGLVMLIGNKKEKTV